MRWDAKRKCFVGWQIDVYVNQGAGRRPKRRRSVYPSESEAKSAENRLKVKSENIKLGIETAEETTPVTVSHLFNKRLEQLNGKEKIRAARVFQTFIDLNGDLEYVSEARGAHFDRFTAQRETDGVSAQTILRELTPLVTAFKRARRLFPRELGDYHPPAIERPRVRTAPRQGVITEPQKDALVKAILSDRLKKERRERTQNRPVIARMFELAWFLGLRLGEIRKLKKSDYDDAQRSLRVVRWKTGTVSLLEFLPDEVCEVLKQAAADSENELLFNLTTSEHTLNCVIKQACQTAGLRHGRKEIDGITFHSNRHSFTTRIIQVADIATAAAYTAHSNKEMVAYYSHASRESKRTAMEKMYGQTNNLEKLRKIYDKIAAGEMTFEEFAREISAEKSNGLVKKSPA